MVKQKTGRAMQEKDVQYTDKNGKVRTRNGASPIRECVVVIEKDTKLAGDKHGGAVPWRTDGEGGVAVFY